VEDQEGGNWAGWIRFRGRGELLVGLIRGAAAGSGDQANSYFYENAEKRVKHCCLRRCLVGDCNFISLL